jgi:transposase
MRPYSMDLRERIVKACDCGESETEVAQRFGVCLKTVQRYRARSAAGALPPRPIPGRPARLPREDEAAFVALMQESPNWTLLQLQHAWQEKSGVFLPRSTLHDHAKRLAARYKKESSGE